MGKSNGAQLSEYLWLGMSVPSFADFEECSEREPLGGRGAC